MEAALLNPFKLEFSSQNLEADYWAQSASRMRGRTTLAVVTVMVLYSIFAFLDPWIVPEVMREVWLIRAFVFVQCGVLILLIYSPVFLRRHQLLIGSLPVLGGSGILLMLGLGGETGRQLYYAGLILALLWTLVFADLRFIYALPISLGLVLGYELIAIFLKPLPGPVVLNNSFFLISGLVMAASAGYTIERYNRISFYQSLVIERERQRSENLLLNVLPKEITEILKDHPGTIAHRFEEASILFADLVGFTPLSAQMAPEEMVDLLNEAFSYFDGLVEKYGLEKIRTIGDNYMVASGVPRPRSDHAQALAHMALEMLEVANRVDLPEGRKLQFRIGINSGPVVAGVIGRKKFQYDLWGEAVNFASRMESQGLPGKIQISQATYELLKDEFVCQPRGSVAVKGLGLAPVWILVGRKPPSMLAQ